MCNNKYAILNIHKYIRMQFNISEEKNKDSASALYRSVLRVVKYFGSTVDFVCF